MLGQAVSLLVLNLQEPVMQMPQEGERRNDVLNRISEGRKFVTSFCVCIIQL